MLEGSVDAGDHVVSKKSLSQNFGLLDWRPGLVKVGQKKTKHPHFANLSQANPSPKSKKKIFLWEPRRLAASLEGLNNTLAIAAGEL